MRDDNNNIPIGRWNVMCKLNHFNKLAVSLRDNIKGNYIGNDNVKGNYIGKENHDNDKDSINIINMFENQLT